MFLPPRLPLRTPLDFLGRRVEAPGSVDPLPICPVGAIRRRLVFRKLIEGQGVFPAGRADLDVDVVEVPKPHARIGVVRGDDELALRTDGRGAGYVTPRLAVDDAREQGAVRLQHSTDGRMVADMDPVMDPVECDAHVAFVDP